VIILASTQVTAFKSWLVPNTDIGPAFVGKLDEMRRSIPDHESRYAFVVVAL
jgi:hypothetical protein